LQLASIWRGASCLIGFASTFATGDGGEVAEDISGFQAFC
jgi:hypothetical protein